MTLEEFFGTHVILSIWQTVLEPFEETRLTRETDGDLGTLTVSPTQVVTPDGAYAVMGFRVGRENVGGEILLGESSPRAICLVGRGGPYGPADLRSLTIRTDAGQRHYLFRTGQGL